MNNFSCYSDLFGNEYDEKSDLLRYKWFYDKNKLDKVGINNDATLLIHDSMVYTMKRFRKIEQTIRGKKTIQLMYKLSNRLSKDTDSNAFSVNTILNERSNYITFKYVEYKDEMIFTNLTYNGKPFS